MTKKSEIGKIGENMAADYLIQNGYGILKRNHKERSDEIDIIAVGMDETLVFCEVKTLSGDINPERGLMPEDNATIFKLHKIARACQIFVGKHPELIDEDRGWRLDLIAIVIGLDGKIKNMNHYKNV